MGARLSSDVVCIPCPLHSCDVSQLDVHICRPLWHCARVSVQVLHAAKTMRWTTRARHWPMMGDGLGVHTQFNSLNCVQTAALLSPTPFTIDKVVIMATSTKDVEAGEVDAG